MDVRWGDALEVLPSLAKEYAGKVDFLLLDGVPKEYLSCKTVSIDSRVMLS